MIIKLNHFQVYFIIVGLLKELNLNNFNTNNVTNMSFMFNECLNELKLKIKSQFKNFKKDAFYD